MRHALLLGKSFEEMIELISWLYSNYRTTYIASLNVLDDQEIKKADLIVVDVSEKGCEYAQLMLDLHDDGLLENKKVIYISSDQITLIKARIIYEPNTSLTKPVTKDDLYITLLDLFPHPK